MTTKGVFHLGLAVIIVIGFFFLSSIVGMFSRAFRIASWILAYSIHNFVLTAVLLLCVYAIYKVFKYK